MSRAKIISAFILVGTKTINRIKNIWITRFRNLFFERRRGLVREGNVYNGVCSLYL
jgi:hypothetical protein